MVLALVAQFVMVCMFLVAPPRLRAPFDLAMCMGVGFAIAGWLDARSSGVSSSATSDG